MFDDPGHRSNAEWLKRSTVKISRPWCPRRCAITDQWLWLKPAVFVRRVITGPGEPVVIDHWVDQKTFVIQELKGWD